MKQTVVSVMLGYMAVPLTGYMAVLLTGYMAVPLTRL